MMDAKSSKATSVKECIELENSIANITNGEKLEDAGSKRYCGVRKMWIAAFTSLLLCFVSGLGKGYSAPAIYDMQHRPSSTIKPTEKESMWIGSTVALGSLSGSLISGRMADKLGRKDTLVYNLIPLGFGWLIICYAGTIPVLLIGRFICGFALGIASCIVPIYCVEIATTEVRGLLGSGIQGFAVIGNLVSVTIGAYISWNYLALNGAVCSILAVVLFCSMPESPRWLLMKNKLQDAIRAMHDLQGGYVNAEKECMVIYQDLQNRPKGNVRCEELMHPSTYKPAIICLILMFFHQFTGIDAIFLYSSSIFEVSKDFMDPKMATIILGVVQVVITLISNLVVDKAGRKLLLALSGSLMAVSLAVFGFYYYKLSLDKTFEDNHGWIPLACCISTITGYSIGLGPVPYLLSAELLPVRVRGTINSVIQFANGMFAFIVTNTFSDVENILTKHGAFWLYSSLAAAGIIFVILFIPETKGKTINEIQDIFDKSRKNTRENIDICVTP